MSFGLFGLAVVSAPADVEVSPATLSEAIEPALMAPAVVPIKVLRDIEFMEAHRQPPALGRQARKGAEEGFPAAPTSTQLPNLLPIQFPLCPPHGQQNELQANLLKLLEACPFDETNPPGLPFISAEKDEANQAFAVVRYAN